MVLARGDCCGSRIARTSGCGCLSWLFAAIQVFLHVGRSLRELILFYRMRRIGRNLRSYCQITISDVLETVIALLETKGTVPKV
jgi:hypothetical protein